MWKGVRLERNLPVAGLLLSVVTQEVQLKECAFKGRAGRFRCCDVLISGIVIEPYSVKRVESGSCCMLDKLIINTS